MLRSQFLVTVAFGMAAAVMSPWLGPAALRLSLGAIAVAALFLLAACVARLRLRERAFELIASGREELPVQAVESERSRLRDRRYRRRLARTLDMITLQGVRRELAEPDLRRSRCRAGRAQGAARGRAAAARPAERARASASRS